jgi:O-antigen ligase
MTSWRRALAWNGPLNRLLALTLALLTALLLIRLPPLLGLVLVIGVAVVVGTLIEPLVGLAVGLFVGPLKAYVNAEVPQLPPQIGHAFVALGLVAWLAHGLARRELRIRPAPVLVALLGFVGAALLSLWDAVDLVGYGVPELIKWAEMALLVIVVAERLSDDRLPWLVGALLLVGLFQAGVGIWQFGLRGDGPSHFAIASALGGDFYRAYGTFEQPNPYAGYLGLTLSLALGASWGTLTSWWRRRGDEGAVRLLPRLLIYASAAGAMLAALGMSWSRGAWLGFAAALVAMTAALPRQTRWGLLLVAALVVGGVGLYVAGLLPEAIAARLTGFVQDVRLEDVRGVPINDANYAVIERLAHWQSALQMVRYHFWTGVGLGCYEPAYAAFALINWPIALGHAHNIYLNLAAETGLIGLLAYGALWAVIVWRTWRVIRRARGFPRGVAIGLLGAWTHLSAHHMLDNLYVNNVHLHIGVMLGLLAFIVYQTNVYSYDR